MGRTGNHYVKWNELDSESQILSAFSYIQNLGVCVMKLEKGSREKILREAEEKESDSDGINVGGGTKRDECTQKQ